MKPFRFRLEKVLAWRRTEMELEQYRTRRLAMELEETERSRAQLAVERTAAERAVLGAGSIDGAQLAAHGAYLARLVKRERELQQRRREQEQRLKQQHQLLMEARRRLRLLERLKARRQEEWLAEANRELEEFAAESHLARWKPAGQ
jgi:flagellar biosynthesis chaperone FliJ